MSLAIQTRKNLTIVICVLSFFSSNSNGEEKRVAFINTLTPSIAVWQLRPADGRTLECGHDKGEIRNSATKEELISTPTLILILPKLP